MSVRVACARTAQTTRTPARLPVDGLLADLQAQQQHRHKHAHEFGVVLCRELHGARSFEPDLLYYFLWVRPRSNRYWTVSGAVPDSPGETASVAEGA